MLIITEDGLVPYGGFSRFDQHSVFNQIDTARIEDNWRLLAGPQPDAILIEIGSKPEKWSGLIQKLRESFDEPPLIIARTRPQIGAERVLEFGIDELILGNDRAMWSEVCDRVSAALERRRQAATLRARMEELQTLQRIDGLTGLATRTALIEALEADESRAHRNGQPFFLLYLDCEIARITNDASGNEIRDIVLAEIARRIRKSCRLHDTVARVDGDLFAILLSDAVDPAHAYRVARKLHQTIEAPLGVEQYTLRLSTSIGIAAYTHSGNAGDLAVQAELAMHEAKRHPQRGKTRFFDRGAEASLLRREGCRLRVQEMFCARSEQIAFQPIYSYAREQSIGAEALFRWHHEESPQEIVAFAEQTAMITEFDCNVMQSAIRRFGDADHTGNTLLNVNASSLSLSERYMRTMHDTLRETRLLPSQICVEIAESALPRDFDAIALWTQRLRRAGIHVALDDFGAGYTSLRYLRDLDVDFLKLDKTLTEQVGHDHSARTLCKSVIDMAHVLGIKVVAEGVEQDDQFEVLRELGSDYAQGNFIAQPSELLDRLAA
ncbi:MAG: EAL domain-containing protein [Pseudomonadota bacterium]